MADIPKSGDLILPNLIVSYTDEAGHVVWIDGQPNPIPLEHLAPSGPGFWVLVNIAFSDDEATKARNQFPNSIYLQILEKGSTRRFQTADGEWYWEGMPIDGDVPIRRGPFANPLEATTNCKEYAETVLRQRRSGDDDAKAGK